MRTLKTSILPIDLKPLYISSIACILIGCSNSETNTAHHAEHDIEHAHTESHAEKTHPHTETKSGEDTQTSVRSAESHVHGGATLSIVSENDKIAIELETPLYNLLGFEYAPQTGAEKTRVHEVEDILASPQTLMSFNKQAKCTYQKPIPTVELFDDHADEDHDSHHDDDHDEHNQEDSHEEDSHKDVHLSYALSCQNIDKLKSVHLEFFNVFSNFTELELVYLGPNKQMSKKISPSHPNVDLTK